MEKFHAMFHGTDVYINGKYKYSSNEILTAYLNLNLRIEELTEWLFQLKAELRDLKLRVDFDDEERFVGYERHVRWTQKLIDKIDAIWPILPPYNRLIQPHQMQRNKLRVCLTQFSDMLDGDRTANLLDGIVISKYHNCTAGSVALYGLQEAASNVKFKGDLTGIAAASGILGGSIDL